MKIALQEVLERIPGFMNDNADVYYCNWEDDEKEARETLEDDDKDEEEK